MYFRQNSPDKAEKSSADSTKMRWRETRSERIGGCACWSVVFESNRHDKSFAAHEPFLESCNKTICMAVQDKGPEQKVKSESKTNEMSRRLCKKGKRMSAWGRDFRLGATTQPVLRINGDPYCVHTSLVCLPPHPHSTRRCIPHKYDSTAEVGAVDVGAALE
jgi:hypothetical protein